MNLKTYIDKQRGRAASLGRAIGVTPVLVSQWANGRRPIPAERCPAIEKATSGEVTCEELRPDVDWQFIRNSAPPVKPITDADTLRQLLDYSVDSGVFLWRENRGRLARTGGKAGSLESHGYLQIKINGRLYLAHRFAWLYVHGVWPQDQIDHINGIRTDSRIANLREATNSQNSINRKTRCDNETGQKGVTQDKRTGKFRAYIADAADGKMRSIGHFDTLQEAVDAREREAAQSYGEFERDPDLRGSGAAANNETTGSEAAA